MIRPRWVKIWFWSCDYMIFTVYDSVTKRTFITHVYSHKYIHIQIYTYIYKYMPLRQWKLKGLGQRQIAMSLPGGRLNIKMSYQYRDPHHKIRRSRDRLMGLPYPGKTVFILRRSRGIWETGAGTTFYYFHSRKLFCKCRLPKWRLFFPGQIC